MFIFPHMKQTAHQINGEEKRDLKWMKTVNASKGMPFQEHQGSK
jgi:hypothetical protein